MSLTAALDNIRELERLLNGWEGILNERKAVVKAVNRPLFTAPEDRSQQYALELYRTHGKDAVLAVAETDVRDAELKIKEYRVKLFKACQDLANQPEE